MGAKPATGGLTLEQIKERQTPTAQPNLAQRIWGDLAQRGVNVASEITNTNQNPLVSGVKATAQMFGGIGDTLTNVVKATPVVGNVYNVAESLIQKGFGSVVDKVSNTKLFQEAAQNPEGTAKIEQFLEALQGGGEIAGNILTAEGVRVGAVKTGDLTKQGLQTGKELSQYLTTKSEAQIQKSILTNFEKGVKPILPGKDSPTKLAKYRKDILQGVESIKKNKGNLNFADDVEGSISGQTPQTLQQFSEAIEQTKKSIFRQYDDLAKAAKEGGIKVDMAPIADELDLVIKNKALSITNPHAVKYAKTLKTRLSDVGQLDATTVQEVIQNYNNSLEAFYKNPTYDTASQAAIDSMIANRMRTALDDGISGITGTRYSALKSQYGSLKAIERDVIKASLRDARRNIKGLIDFTDIFSGGQVVNGILTLNPGQVASGLVQKGLAELYKFKNNPNRAIQKLFNLSEELDVPRPSNPFTGVNSQAGFVKFDIGKAKKLEDEFQGLNDTLKQEAPTMSGGNWEQYGKTAQQVLTAQRNEVYPQLTKLLEGIKKGTFDIKKLQLLSDAENEISEIVKTLGKKLDPDAIRRAYELLELTS